MGIPHALRSRFLSRCEQALAAHRAILDSGAALTIAVEPGGYSGRLIVTILPGVPTTFQAEWGASRGLVVPPNNPRRNIGLKMQVQPELFLVGIVGGHVAATVMAGYDGHRGRLYSVAVAPDLKRQGLGRGMAQGAEARLKAVGCRKIDLQARASNAAVIGFYETSGSR